MCQVYRVGRNVELPVGTQEKKKLDPAIKYLKESIKETLWLPDGSAPVPPRAGEDVFNKEKSAVTKLRDLRTLSITNQMPDDATVLDWILRLVEVDQTLAEMAIAGAAGGNADKLKRANDELMKGDADAANNYWDKAIDHYKNAWKYASQA